MAQKSLPNIIKSNLRPRLVAGYNRSKHEDKIADREDAKRLGDKYNPANGRIKYNFYTRATYDEVCRELRLFWKDVNQHEGHRVPWEELKNYVESYIDRQIGRYRAGEISARTVSKKRTNLSKGLLVDLSDIRIPVRSGDSIKGRLKHLRNNRFNPETKENQERSRVYSAIGVRRNEYRCLPPSEFARGIEAGRKVGIEVKPDMFGRMSNLQPVYNSEGQVERIITLIAKHGKVNTANIIFPENREYITELFRTGEIYRFYDVPQYYEAHADRRAYCRSIYEHYARPLDEIPIKELYITRDGSHRIFDKKALDICSAALGHGEHRHFDIVHSYLTEGD